MEMKLDGDEVHAVAGSDGMKAILLAFRCLGDGEEYLIRLCALAHDPSTKGLLVVIGEVQAMLLLDQARFLAETLDRTAAMFPGTPMAQAIPQLAKALRLAADEAETLSGAVH